MELTPAQLEELQHYLTRSMDLMAEMYWTGELNNQNSGRLNGIRARLVMVAEKLNLDIGPKALSSRSVK